MQNKSFRSSWKNKPSVLSGSLKRDYSDGLSARKENSLSRRKGNLIKFCLALILCVWTLTACTGVGADSAGKGKPAEPAALSEQPVKKTPAKAANEEKEIAGKDSTKEAEIAATKQSEPDVYHEWSFLAVGDIMVHKEQLKRAYRPASDSFDFTPSFVYVQPFIESANYAFANLETTLAGRGANTKSESGSFYRGYSGYPNFNAPESLADALKAAGFDFLGTANNHSLDKGLTGVINTLAYLRQIDLPHTGTFDTQEERDTLKVVETGDLKIGVIAYTYATNGISLKAEEMYRINTLDNYHTAQIERLYETVRRAKEQPIDLLFVMMHYGNEYWEKPEKTYQAGITQKLMELGVDMVIGSHPHTLQPLIYTEDDKILLKKSEIPQLPVLTADSQSTVNGLTATGENAAAVKTNESETADTTLNQTTSAESKDPVTESAVIKADSGELDEGQPWKVAGIYSLGNFISSQRIVSEYKTDTDTGAMMKWVYQWKNKEKPVLVKIGILPTIVVWQDDRATVLPINDISIAAAKADPSMKITAYTEGRIENAKNTVLKRLTAFFPDSLINSMQTEGDGFTYLYLHPEIKGR